METIIAKNEINPLHTPEMSLRVESFPGSQETQTLDTILNASIKNYSVLLVGFKPSESRGLIGKLYRAGFKVRTVAEEQEAYELLERTHVDLVIIGQNYSLDESKEFLREVRVKKEALLPSILILTEEELEFAEEIKLLNLGADLCVQKENFSSQTLVYLNLIFSSLYVPTPFNPWQH